MNRRSSQAIESLLDDVSSDLGGGSPLNMRPRSRQSVASPSEDRKRISKLGSSFRGLNNGNLSRQRGPGSREMQEKPPGNTES